MSQIKIKKYSNENISIGISIAEEKKLYVNGWTVEGYLCSDNLKIKNQKKENPQSSIPKNLKMKEIYIVENEDNSEKIGALYLSVEEQLMFYVRKEYRKQGIGRKMFLNFLENTDSDSLFDIKIGDGIKGSNLFFKKIGFNANLIDLEFKSLITRFTEMVANGMIVNDGMLKNQYTENNSKITIDTPARGHCYHASEALYYLMGGKLSGYQPCFIKFENNDTHWFLKHKKSGRIVDVTSSQFKKNFEIPYEKGTNRGFMQQSNNSKEIMRLFIEKDRYYKSQFKINEFIKTEK